MSCGRYQVLTKAGEPVGVSVMHDDFAAGFSTLQRLGDHPCPGDQHQAGPLAKAVSWAKAEASRLIQGDVPEEQYQARLEACRTCQKLQAGEPVGWCGACGCGTRRRAELSVKARMPAATCPLGRW